MPEGNIIEGFVKDAAKKVNMFGKTTSIPDTAWAEYQDRKAERDAAVDAAVDAAFPAAAGPFNKEKYMNIIDELIDGQVLIRDDPVNAETLRQLKDIMEYLYDTASDELLNEINNLATVVNIFNKLIIGIKTNIDLFNETSDTAARYLLAAEERARERGGRTRKTRRRTSRR